MTLDAATITAACAGMATLVGGVSIASTRWRNGTRTDCQQAIDALQKAHGECEDRNRRHTQDFNAYVARNEKRMDEHTSIILDLASKLGDRGVEERARRTMSPPPMRAVNPEEPHR